MLNERFWNKVDKNANGGCWEWQATTNGKKGYGMASVRYLGYKNKQLAHRMSYLDAHGSIPDGLFVLHKCDNPLCVNPDHLWVGTNTDNVRDMIAKGRDFRNPRKGEDHQFSVISDADTIRVRRMYVEGVGVKSLMKIFSLGGAVINDVLSGRTRKILLGKHGSPTLEELKEAARIHRKSAAKITEKEAREIKDLLNEGMTGRAIAKRYGIHPATVSDIRLGKTWRSA